MKCITLETPPPAFLSVTCSFLKIYLWKRVARFCYNERYCMHVKLGCCAFKRNGLIYEGQEEHCQLNGFLLLITWVCLSICGVIYSQFLESLPIFCVHVQRITVNFFILPHLIFTFLLRIWKVIGLRWGSEKEWRNEYIIK